MAGDFCSLVSSSEGGTDVCVAVGAQAPPPPATSSYRRFPCKARNMPPSHRDGAAYIEVPPNATHGMLLACSHPACSGNGARKRFCYCVICKIPVSKRNFMNRHAHGLVEKPNVVLARERQNASAAARLAADRLARDSLSGGEDDQASSTADIDSLNLEEEEEEDDEVRAAKQGPFDAAVALQQAVMLHHDQQPQATLPNRRKSSNSPETTLQTNELIWLSLLHNRPKNLEDQAAMQAWMSSLMQVGAAVAAKKRRKSNDSSSSAAQASCRSAPTSTHMQGTSCPQSDSLIGNSNLRWDQGITLSQDQGLQAPLEEPNQSWAQRQPNGSPPEALLPAPHMLERAASAPAPSCALADATNESHSFPLTFDSMEAMDFTDLFDCL